MQDTGAPTSGATGEGTGGVTPASAEGSVWLSYADLAERLQISPESAKRRAIKRRWPKRLGNDGRSLVAVPPDILRSPHWRSRPDAPANRGIGGITGASTGDATDALQEAHREEMDRLMAAHAAELARLDEAHQETKGRLEAELGRLRADLDHERKAREAEAERAAAERQRLIDALAEASRPWWHRLLPPRRD